ncbi:hypothetical protein [Chloracidobacterium thermophilum]|uniref:hypothetical protein n=1 Tax=Chloracidobacterium thermophilum TaxID=458033 RepID=UPI001BB2D6BF|nr:hypothetical protein [Chloracidobacterium thermophilum]QUV80218.1 hypothetical protein J8C08_15810 [Chloracidobacterium thermophilum]
MGLWIHRFLLGSEWAGQAIGKPGRLVVSYSVSGGGCWDNSDRAYLVRQVEAAQREAKAIIASLPGFPAKSPSLQGGDG